MTPGGLLFQAAPIGLSRHLPLSFPWGWGEDEGSGGGLVRREAHRPLNPLPEDSAPLLQGKCNPLQTPHITHAGRAPTVWATCQFGGIGRPRVSGGRNGGRSMFKRMQRVTVLQQPRRRVRRRHVNAV